MLEFALGMRRRVKEQLKRIGAMTSYDVNFSYIDKADLNKKIVSVPEQGSLTLIPVGTLNPGQVYTVAYEETNRICLLKLESQVTKGNGRHDWTGISDNHGARNQWRLPLNF